MALNANQLDVAERLLKPHLKEDPFDPAAIRMLAELAARIYDCLHDRTLHARLLQGDVRHPSHDGVGTVGTTRWNLVMSSCIFPSGRSDSS